MSDISNEELDRFMAESVMGWEVAFAIGDRSPYWDCYRPMDVKSYNTKGCLIRDWNPSTNLNQAMECVEREFESHEELEGWLNINFEHGHSFTMDNSEKRWCGDCDKYPARAVCLALKAFAESREVADEGVKQRA